MNIRLIVVLVLLAFQTSLSAIADDRPNILIIVGDDMGYADVGWHGCVDIPTPNLDSLALAGARFSNAYVSGPYCSPTRAGLLTGRYQTRFGHEFNPTGQQGMPVSERTLADRLKAVGYKTGIVGKWHLGNQKEMHPQQRGFDEFYGFLGGSHSYFQRNGFFRGKEPVRDMDYATDAFGREAVSFIERHRESPWFLYLAFNAVHTPMDATDDRIAKFPNEANKTRKTYNAMMLAMDEAVGTVRNKLAETDQLDNTLIFFFSDNGGPTMVGVTVNGSRNTPLRGSKRTTLEGGIRVPFFVVWPKRIKPMVYDRLAIQLDVHATALSAAGIDISSINGLEGIDLIPYLSGDRTSEPHDALYWRFGDQMAVRAGDWKLVKYDTNADKQTGNSREVTPYKLYNLSTDIHEDNDLSASNPEKVEELKTMWANWNQSNIAPLWGKGSGDDEAKPDKSNGSKLLKQE